MGRFDFKIKIQMIKIKQKKSQITMLMIIALVLFIVVGLVLYLSKSAIKKQSQQSVKKTQETAFETQPIKEFVQKCLDKLAKDAVVLLGKQGGYIYKSQGGALIDYKDPDDEGLFFVNYNGNKAAYNIMPPRIMPEIYPWETFPYNPDTGVEDFGWSPYFGMSNLPDLYPIGRPNSIQFQLETFIDSNIPKCADFSTFEEQGLEIVMNSTKTSVIIGSNDVSIQSKIPITITNPKTNEFTEISDFSTNLQLRLKDLYYFTKDLIGNDVKNIKLDISDLENERDSFKIRVIRDVLAQDDVIVITDETSLVYGKPYEYVFGRRNRLPALYYIKDNVLEFPKDYEIKQEELIKPPDPRWEDPDEDEVTPTIKPALPYKFKETQVNFKVEASDGILSDNQIITVNRAS